MFKRIALFVLTNALIIIMISTITSALGLHGYLSARGIDYKVLAITCAIWGFSGAFISLLLSRFMAKMAMNVVLIDPKLATGPERKLIDTIYHLAKKAGLSTMPEVGIYHSNEVNAFATGPTKNRALVAVSSGLLNQMNADEIEAVLGHEISHVANGDMVTMTLIQGVINAFALFLSRIVAYAISTALSRGDEKEEGISYLTYSILSLVFDILFTLLGSIVVAAFSRWREYRADQGGSQLAGRDKMISALKRLKQTVSLEDNQAPSLSALKIAHHASWTQLFSTHPTLDQRIERLQNR